MKKLAVIFPELIPGDLSSNLDSHLKYLEELEDSCLAIFPPLGLSGDGLGSLFKRPEILEAKSHLDKFINTKSYVLVGLPLKQGKRLFSVYALIKEDILGYYPLKSRDSIFSDPELFDDGYLASLEFPLKIIADDSFSYPGKEAAIEKAMAKNSGSSLYISASQDSTTSGGIHGSRYMLFSQGLCIKKGQWVQGLEEFKIEEDKVKLRLDSFIEPELEASKSAYPFLAEEDRDKIYSDLLTHQAKAYATRLKRTGLSHSLLGISGGLDSSWALVATLKAHELLDLPKENIHCIVMPGFGSTDKTMKAALDLLDAFQLAYEIISIDSAVRGHFKDIGHEESVHNLVYENSQARERTQILMDLANKYEGLVVGTGDMSENAQGWSTYNGDQMSMYAVNAGLPKTLIQDLIAWYGEKKGGQIKDSLFHILKRPISPELLPAGKKGEILQKTEESLGSYKLIDFILYHFLIGLPLKDIKILLKEVFPVLSDRDIEKSLGDFVRRFISQQFKRTAAPDGIKLTQPSLLDFDMASDISYAYFLKEIK